MLVYMHDVPGIKQKENKKKKKRKEKKKGINHNHMEYMQKREGEGVEDAMPANATPETRKRGEAKKTRR